MEKEPSSLPSAHLGRRDGPVESGTDAWFTLTVFFAPSGAPLGGSTRKGALGHSRIPDVNKQILSQEFCTNKQNNVSTILHGQAK